MQLYRRIMIVLILAMVCPGCSGCVREEAAGISVSDYAGQYDSDVQELMNAETDGLLFQDCVFQPFPGIDRLEVLTCSDRDITAEEGLAVMEEWIRNIGLEGQIDTGMEIRDASGQLPRDESRSYPYDYPGVYEHRSELSSGQGFFINTDLCYLQMGNGFMQMSDGRISRLLGGSARPMEDAFGFNQEETVEEGDLQELGQEEYELPGGRISVQEGAEAARDYFLAGTPYPYGEGIDVGISRVRVFRIKDQYGYEFHTFRIYQGIPFATTERSAVNMYGAGYDIKEEAGCAYVIDADGVTAFCNYREAQQLSVLESHTRMLGIQEAVNRMREQLARNLTIRMENAGLVYCPICYGEEETGETQARVCWMFDGWNTVNQWRVRIYIDAVTGELYYYEYQDQEG